MNLEWTQEQIDTLVTMHTDGKPIQAIATALGRSRSSVKMYLQRHRHELHLPARIGTHQDNTATSLDKRWNWLITNKWRIQ